MPRVFMELWAHGHAFFPEHIGPEHLRNNGGFPWHDVHGGMRFGWGTAFEMQPNRLNFFHVSIPTPFQLPNGSGGGDIRTRVTRYFVRYIQEVPFPQPEDMRLWDAEVVLDNVQGAQNVLNLRRPLTRGTRSTPSSGGSTTFLIVRDNLDLPVRVGGVGISIGMRTPADGAGRLTFVGAGAVFFADIP